MKIQDWGTASRVINQSDGRPAGPGRGGDDGDRPAVYRSAPGLRAPDIIRRHLRQFAQACKAASAFGPRLKMRLSYLPRQHLRRREAITSGEPGPTLSEAACAINHEAPGGNSDTEVSLPARS